MLTNEAAHAIAAAWAAGFTKLGNGGDVTDWEKIFAHECKWTVARTETQAAGGSGTGMVMFSTKDEEPVNALDSLLAQLKPCLPWIPTRIKMNFKGIQQFQAPLLAKQNYARSELTCKGVQGATALLEFKRFNTSGENYMTGYGLLTVDASGLICEAVMYAE
jgi:hypothetical protein